MFFMIIFGLYGGYFCCFCMQTLFFSLFFCPETKEPKILRSKGEMGGKLPLTNRHFDGIQKTVKMTNTAVGLSRLCADLSPLPRWLTTHTFCATLNIIFLSKIPRIFAVGLSRPRRLTSYIWCCTKNMKIRLHRCLVQANHLNLDINICVGTTINGILLKRSLPTFSLRK